jgi:hypothetical protein
MHVPLPYTQKLEEYLDRSACDARERLIYCVESELRLHVQMFVPLPSQLSYPDILYSHAIAGAASAASTRAAAASVSSASAASPPQQQQQQQLQSAEMAATWFPPLRDTLFLLSQLYGVVDTVIFEDVARKSILGCIQALEIGAGGVRYGTYIFFLCRIILLLICLLFCLYLLMSK